MLSFLSSPSLASPLWYQRGQSRFVHLFVFVAMVTKCVTSGEKYLQYFYQAIEKHATLIENNWMKTHCGDTHSSPPSTKVPYPTPSRARTQPLIHKIIKKKKIRRQLSNVRHSKYSFLSISPKNPVCHIMAPIFELLLGIIKEKNLFKLINLIFIEIRLFEF